MIKDSLWMFIAGIGFFLYGMIHLESSLKELVGRRFKSFIKKNTSNRFLAIINGILTTALFQSSSLVILIVIAFVGAGVISLSNSLGIILGANLGTTFTGWILANLGFSFKLSLYTYPLIGIGSLGLVFTDRRKPLYHLFGLLAAFGFLLMGLDFMKTSMTGIAEQMDISKIKNFGTVQYFLFGFLLTAVIQSSSASMGITLSALYSQIIGLEAAAAIVIGSDLGTTITAILGSLKGTPTKKRVGLAHFSFNAITCTLALFLMPILLYFIQNYLLITNDLISLVIFHSLFNLIGILIFAPFLGVFEKLLLRFYKVEKYNCSYIHQVDPQVPDAALAVINKELFLFLKKVGAFNRSLIGIDKSNSQSLSPIQILKFLLTSESIIDEYSALKEVEEELLVYFKKVQGENLLNQESSDFESYILALRNGIFSAKAAKDIWHNLKEFSQSSSDLIENFLVNTKQEYQNFYHDFDKICCQNSEINKTEELTKLAATNEASFNNINRWIYKKAVSIDRKSEFTIASLLNVNKEIYNANKYLFEALVALNQPPSC